MTFKGKAAIIQFPGVNCEYETAEAVRIAGVEAALFRWNEDPGLLEECRAVILPDSSACRPKFPKDSVFPRFALPRIRPFWIFRCLVLFGCSIPASSLR